MTEFETLYRRYAADVYRFALYLCGEHAQAQDLTSEAFVRAWNSQERIRTATARAYLFTIARNLFLTQRNRQSRQDQLDESMPDAAVSPYITAERNDEVNRVLAALQEMPELDRTILLLRLQEELSYEEIAQSVGLTMPALKVRLHRARLKLTSLLTKQEKHYENHQVCCH